MNESVFWVCWWALGIIGSVILVVVFKRNYAWYKPVHYGDYMLLIIYSFLGLFGLAAAIVVWLISLDIEKGDK